MCFAGQFTFDHTMDMSSKEESFAEEETRLATFNGRWKKESILSSTALAKAGFFYTKQFDRVKCYYCGVKIQGWQPDSNVDVIHARLSPMCCFLRYRKGQEFMEKYAVTEVNCDSGSIICDLTPYRTSACQQQEQTSAVNSRETLSRPNSYRPKVVMRYKDKCTHCYLRGKDVELLPCKHSFCESCALAMRKCYLCRRQKRSLRYL